MAVNTPLAFFNIATTVLECVRSRIEDVAGLPEFGRVCVVPGDVAWDECTCGQLTINNPTQFSSVSFPTPSIGANETQCGAPYTVSTFEVTALRCAPGPDRNGHPPTCTALQNAAQLLYQDKFYMRTAVQCCLAELRNTDLVEDYALGQTVETGPRGGCVGATLSFNVSLISNCPCE
jgi:hypothetical protein